MADAKEHTPELRREESSETRPPQDAAFEPPRIAVIGSVEELTAAGAGPGGDRFEAAVS
jgi:hypothetical protein